MNPVGVNPEAWLRLHSIQRAQFAEMSRPRYGRPPQTAAGRETPAHRAQRVTVPADTRQTNPWGPLRTQRPPCRCLPPHRQPRQLQPLDPLRRARSARRCGAYAGAHLRAGFATVR